MRAEKLRPAERCLKITPGSVLRKLAGAADGIKNTGGSPSRGTAGSLVLLAPPALMVRLGGRNETPNQ